MNLYERNIPYQLSVDLLKSFYKFVDDDACGDDELSQWFSALRENNSDEEIAQKFERLTSQPEKVILMSVHKSKGLEFNTVVFVDYEIDAPTEFLVQQELNCKYIAYTRAK